MTRSLKLLCVSLVAFGATTAASVAMPVSRAGVSSQGLFQDVAYRRHGRRYYTGRRAYNPGPALFGAMAGVIGAGIAASQPHYYYSDPAYGYPAYGGYGYGYPYGYGW